LAAAAVVSVPVAMGGAAGAEAVCRSDSFSWSGDQLFVPWASTLSTGVVIPAAGAGETLRVTSASYSTYDRYGEGQVPNRAEVGQMHEQVGIVIGGTPVGSLSADIPNGISEGAPSDFFSGIVNGSFGGAGTAISGGELVVRHSSLYGFTESPNSVRVSQIDVTVERCSTPPTTEPPVTEPPVTEPPITQPPATQPTTTPAPTTTQVGSGGPTTTPAPTTVPAPTTTQVGSGGPTTTPGPTTVPAPTTTQVGSGGPTTVPGGALPVTGGNVNGSLALAVLFALLGGALLLARRPSTRS